MGTNKDEAVTVNKKIEIRISMILCLGLLVVSNAYSFYMLFVKGVYAWHITTIETKNAFLFLVLFTATTVALCKIVPAYKKTILWLNGVASLVALGLVLPYFCAWFYFEIIFYVGEAFLGCIIKKEETNVATIFLAGLCVWGVFAIVFSGLGVGTINALRVMTLSLAVVAFIMLKRKPNTMADRFLHYFSEKLDFKSQILLIVLVGMSVIVAAKTNVGQDIDSLWYMLKPEYMLVGDNSFYDYLGYGAFVHYYPKLVELFFLPLSGLGDYSFILLGNVMMYNLFAYVVYSVMGKLCEGISERTKLFFLVLIFTLPVIANMAATAKGDIFGSCLVIYAVAELIQFIKTKNVWNMLVALIALAFSTGTKVTFILWGGIVFFVLLLYVLVDVVKSKSFRIFAGINKRYVIFGCLAIVFIVGIHARTFLLTGYPIYPLMINIWNELGFEANYGMLNEYSSGGYNIAAMGGMQWIAERLYQFFLNPNALSHTIMCWPTALAAQIGVSNLLIRKKDISYNSHLKVLIFLTAVEAIIALYYVVTQVQVDGNYFIVPMVLVILTGIACLWQKCSEYISTKMPVTVLILFCVLVINIPLTIVSNWSWGYGIKTFPTQLIGDNFDSKDFNRAYFEQQGYAKIAEYLENKFEDGRALISGNEDRIQAAVETYWSLFTSTWSATENVDTYEHFCEYVERAGITGFVVLNNDDTVYREYVERMSEEFECEYFIQDDSAVFYQFKIIG